MKWQYDESEMIDVVEVSNRLAKVKQQKYVCRCGSCVETGLGPERALPGSRYSLAFAIKVVLDKWLATQVPSSWLVTHDDVSGRAPSWPPCELASCMAAGCPHADAHAHSTTKRTPQRITRRRSASARTAA